MASENPPSKYAFTEYSSDWPSKFSQAARSIEALLGDELVAVHHIGSTSVPGLAAKPIIDLLPLVRNIDYVDRVAHAFETAGYKSWGEYGLAGRRYFTKDHGECRTHNVHIYQADHFSVERHLAFCAYLRNHEPARVEYEALKRRAYARHPADIAAYNDFKNEWIKATERTAIDWYRRPSG